ncbi:MarR family winged helix-turn-helix transcriptional regulator [Eubacterium oxidoreducens]|uniref:DNA-binding transcriptional regulator, MarR family n=1 Tax=Eubacterium oxidoreducens TaxID=1732 RepID=A0A1G6BXK9_EUBOX|nr:MarR family transcriptional regulator [Eubacterium oxidoreducens]SDB25338.1 DNA-binding transcriptional regulator, MarR family [Eubacterium oxidoreducens]
MAEDIKILRDVSILMRRHQGNLTRKLAKYNLSAGEQPIFMAICANPGISQDKIAEVSFVDKGFVTRVIKSLEGNGFISRQKDETDRRINRVFPTEDGLKTYQLVKKELKHINDVVAEEFSPEELMRLESDLKRLEALVNSKGL